MKNWIKILLILFVLGIAAGVYIYIFVYNKPHQDISKATPAFTLQASALFNTFKNNKAEAGKKFTGQVLQVNGTISKIEKKDSLTIVVFVFAQDEFGDAGIRCTMASEITNLQNGMKVDIKGICNGYNDTDVILEKCSIIKK